MEFKDSPFDYNMKKVIIEEECKTKDLVKECEKRGISFSVLKGEDILAMPSSVVFDSVLFCGTEIIQYHLWVMGLSKFVPDIYCQAFRNNYGRSIWKTRLEYIKDALPIFIRPLTNDKAFRGRIITDTEEIKEIGDFQVYASEVVEFTSEYRLLIGNGKIYGCGYIKGEYQAIPRPFLDVIIQRTNLNISDTQNFPKFCGVDVGCLKSEKWVVVKVKPPFALEGYGIPISQYFQFILDFFQSLS